MKTLIDRRQRTARPTNLGQIVQSGLCMGCGLCQSIAGKETIEFVTTREGRVRPIERRPISASDWAVIERTCPGLNVIGGDDTDQFASTKHDQVWGRHLRIVIGHASDPEVRYRATSGGTLTALSRYLIQAGHVDFILQVRASKDRPMRSETVMSFHDGDIVTSAGARYGPTSPLDGVKEALDQGKPFGFVGKPCDIAGLRLYAREDHRVSQYCKMMLSLQCGGGPEFQKSRDLVHDLGLREEDVTLMRYRGYGNPGRARIEARDGRAFELTYLQMWDDESKWCSQSRCRICPDGIGECADMVVGDYWPGCVPQGEDAGFNSIMVRTGRGIDLFDQAVNAGVLTVVRDLDIQDMTDTQPHQVRKKAELWARLAGMRAAGHLVPEIQGLRLREIAAEQSFLQNVRAARGARLRCHRGRFSEPPAIDVKVSG